MGTPLSVGRGSRRGVDVNAVRLKAKKAKIAKEAQLEAMKALVADLAGAEVRARATQIEAMKAVVQDLPINRDVMDNQGNSAVQNKGKSAFDHDCIPDDGDDDEWWAINGAEVEMIVSHVETKKRKATELSIDKDDEDDDDWGDDELSIQGESD